MGALLFRGRRLAWLGLLLVCIVAAAGCVDETKVGDKTVFTNQWWAPLTVILLSVIAGPAGFFLREFSGRVAFGLMIICPFGVLLGISLYTDYCEVDPSGFKGQMGFFGTKKFEGKFDDISDISLVERRSRRSRSVYLVYRTKGGKQGEFALGNEMTKSAAPLILGYAQDKGIPISEGL